MLEPPTAKHSCSEPPLRMHNLEKFLSKRPSFSRISLWFSSSFSQSFVCPCPQKGARSLASLKPSVEKQFWSKKQTHIVLIASDGTKTRIFLSAQNLLMPHLKVYELLSPQGATCILLLFRTGGMTSVIPAVAAILCLWWTAIREGKWEHKQRS